MFSYFSCFKTPFCRRTLLKFAECFLPVVDTPPELFMFCPVVSLHLEKQNGVFVSNFLSICQMTKCKQHDSLNMWMLKAFFFSCKVSDILHNVSLHNNANISVGYKITLTLIISSHFRSILVHIYLRSPTVL